MEDSQIVELYLARSESAIAESQTKYGSRLRGVAQGIVQDLPTAQECENDVYLAAWDAIPPHTPRSYLFAFLARIARHIALNWCRSRHTLKRSAYVCQLSAEMEQCLPAPDTAACRLEELEFARVLNSFLAGLDSRRRCVFLRRYWYMDSVQDIAARYGMGESAVKSMLLRTRRALRTYLEQEGITL